MAIILVLIHCAHQRRFKSTEISHTSHTCQFLSGWSQSHSVSISHRERAQAKLNSSEAQGKQHVKSDSRKSREILGRKSVTVFPVLPMSRLRAFFKTNGQSSHVTVCHKFLVLLTQEHFLASLFFFFDFKLNIYQLGFKKFSPKKHFL